MISKIILGTAQLGLDYGINNSKGLLSDSEVENILDLAYESGIRKLDTAADYGNSEIRIGSFNHRKNKFKIITKFSKLNNVDWKQSLNNSLAKLKTNKVETVLFHSFDSYLKSKHLLHNIIEEGKDVLFDNIGVSVYTNEELNLLFNDNNIELIQCPFNMLDNHNQRAEIIEKIKKSGKIVYTRSVFLQGLFFMDPNRIPNKLSQLSNYCSRLHLIAKENNLAIGHLALQYVLSKEYIDALLIGVDSAEQLSKNINWIKTPISPTILSQIDEIKVAEISLLNPSLW